MRPHDVGSLEIQKTILWGWVQVWNINKRWKWTPLDQAEKSTKEVIKSFLG